VSLRNLGGELLSPLANGWAYLRRRPSHDNPRSWEHLEVVQVDGGVAVRAKYGPHAEKYLALAEAVEVRSK